MKYRLPNWKAVVAVLQDLTVVAKCMSAWRPLLDGLYQGLKEFWRLL